MSAETASPVPAFEVLAQGHTEPPPLVVRERGEQNGYGEQNGRDGRSGRDRCVEPDWQAYAPLVALHRTPLYRIALLLTGDAASAEDLVSDTLIALHRPWTDGRIDHFAAYARRALHNRFLSEVRRQETLITVLPRVVPGRDGDDSATTATERIPVVHALAQLPPRQRAVVVARYYSDLSVEDTAQLLNISTGTVKSTTHDALARLRVALEGIEP
jgi:RNA polymerase sigma-70 factor (sigma-E family)